MPEWQSLQSIATVATALLAGGMVFFSFVFAPLVFKTLDTDNAGRMVRAVFPVYYLLGLLLSALAAVFFWPASPTDGAVMGAVAVVFALARQLLRPAIDASRERRKEDPAAAKGFRRLHGLSMILNPRTLRRVRNSELKTEGEALTIPEIFNTLTDAVFHEGSDSGTDRSSAPSVADGDREPGAASVAAAADAFGSDSETAPRSENP